MSLIGQKAPEWSAPAYADGEEKVLSNADFAVKWYIIYMSIINISETKRPY